LTLGYGELTSSNILLPLPKISQKPKNYLALEWDGENCPSYPY
jgi:hypothetical protein